MTTEEERQAWIQGLRDIADLIEGTPEIPLPCEANFDVWFYGEDAAAQMATVRRLIGGRFDKETTGDGSYLWLRRHFGPHTLDLSTPRETVCERVVLGTETVEIPDPQAPKVSVERDVVEWVCSPLLDSEQAAS